MTLDARKVYQQLQQIVPDVSVRTDNERQIAAYVWAILINNTLLAQQAIADAGGLLVPQWLGCLGTIQEIKSEINSYHIVSVDGSQIYPDRHQGIFCFLLNMGIVHIYYRSIGPGTVFLESIPSVHTQQTHEQEAITPEVVNTKRGALELQTGYTYMSSITMATCPALFICDGSLIFWHLNPDNTPDKHELIDSYLGILEDFYTKKLLIAGYISFPKNKELVNIIRSALEQKLVVTDDHANHRITYLTDSDITALYLKPGTRSALFSHQSPVVSYYPKHLKPYFFYINNGLEIGRVEIPAWIALDEQLLTIVATIIFDQCVKGQGYPVALSEAHEQAVVKNADRELFYHLLSTVSQRTAPYERQSQKSFKKRVIAI